MVYYDATLVARERVCVVFTCSRDNCISVPNPDQKTNSGGSTSDTRGVACNRQGMARTLDKDALSAGITSLVENIWFLLRFLSTNAHGRGSGTCSRSTRSDRVDGKDGWESWRALSTCCTSPSPSTPHTPFPKHSIYDALLYSTLSTLPLITIIENSLHTLHTCDTVHIHSSHAFVT